MTYRTIQYSEDGQTGILTLNRPDKLNAVNIEMRDELRVFFRDRLTKFNAKVLILTGWRAKAMEKCTGCKACVKVCPMGATTVSDD